MKKFLSLYSTLGAVMFLSMSVSNTASAFSFDSPKKVRYDTTLIDAMTKANKECYARMVKKEKELTTENESLRSDKSTLSGNLNTAIREKNVENVRRLLSGQMNSIIRGWYKDVLGEVNAKYKKNSNYSAIVVNLDGYRAILENSMRDAEEEAKSKIEELEKGTEDPKENEGLKSYLDGIMNKFQSQCNEYTVEKAVKDLNKEPIDVLDLNEQQTHDQNFGETQGGAQRDANSLFGSK